MLSASSSGTGIWTDVVAANSLPSSKRGERRAQQTSDEPERMAYEIRGLHLYCNQHYHRAVASKSTY